MCADVSLFFAEEEKARSGRSRDAVFAICRERGWNYQPREIKLVRTPEGRPLHMVRPDIASGLYPRAHRTPVLTLVYGTDPVVPLVPNMAEALLRRKHMPLQQYLEYKSCWIRIQPELDNHAWAGMFAAWIDQVDSDGEHDPRLLPFHVFDGRGAHLEEPARRAEFNHVYGAGSARHDLHGTRWSLIPRLFHGREVLRVGGLSLSVGYHWDVVPRESWRIETPSGIWRVDRHVNIYPDAAMRWKQGHVTKLV